MSSAQNRVTKELCTKLADLHICYGAIINIVETKTPVVEGKFHLPQFIASSPNQQARIIACWIFEMTLHAYRLGLRLAADMESLEDEIPSWWAYHGEKTIGQIAGAIQCRFEMKPERTCDTGYLSNLVKFLGAACCMEAAATGYFLGATRNTALVENMYFDQSMYPLLLGSDRVMEILEVDIDEATFAD